MKKMIVLILAFLILAFCVGCEAEKPAEPCEVHAYGEWVLEKEAACMTEGEMKRVCQNCDASETKAVDPLEHSFGDWAMQKEATCDAEGMEARSCSLCGASEERATSMVSHVMGEWTVAKESTCTETGLKKMSCVNCEYAVTEDLPLIDHEFSDWFVEKNSTCDAPGIDYRFCKHCEAKETKGTAILEHDTKGISCNHCGKYNVSPSEYGKSYSLGSGAFVNIKSCIITETETETIYKIVYSAKWPQNYVKIDNPNDNSLQEIPSSSTPWWESMPTYQMKDEGLIALRSSSKLYYAGEMKGSYCEIHVPKGVEIVAIEYVPVFPTFSYSGVTLFIEGTLYWQIPVEE